MSDGETEIRTFMEVSEDGAHLTMLDGSIWQVQSWDMPTVVT